ncbi:MAG: NADH-quinone oxidoreductase subunit NuoE [bacterium]
MDFQQLKEIREIISNWQGKPGALMPVLQEIQERFGYLSKEAMEEVSKGLNVPIPDVYGVATFYHFFSLKPKGKYQIQVCEGTACYVKGAKRVLEKFQELLGIKEGEVTPDGKFSIESVRCIGACSHAPAVMINGRVYGRMNSEKIQQVLKSLK